MDHQNNPVWKCAAMMRNLNEEELDLILPAAARLELHDAESKRLAMAFEALAFRMGAR